MNFLDYLPITLGRMTFDKSNNLYISYLKVSVTSGLREPLTEKISSSLVEHEHFKHPRYF